MAGLIEKETQKKRIHQGRIEVKEKNRKLKAQIQSYLGAAVLGAMLLSVMAVPASAQQITGVPGHHGFGAQVNPQQGVGRITVGGDDDRVLVREDTPLIITRNLTQIGL
jgi:hypothetical protein